MYYDYPIEQLARSARTRFQMGFARLTMHLMPSFDDVTFEPSLQGLKIIAANEQALTNPGEVLRQIHADDVEIKSPRVRLMYDTAVREPIMWIRAAVPQRYAELVVQDLVGRGALIEEVDWMAPKPVVRAKAPLRLLLGYPQSVAGLTQNTAELRMRLSHYAPIPPEPGEAA